MTAAPEPVVSVSVVSHRQAALTAQFLADLKCVGIPFEVLITINVPEDMDLTFREVDPRFRQIRNAHPKGFGANHNAAFQLAKGQYFCVANPDIRLASDPFPALIDMLKERSLGVVGPLVLTPDGRPEDSARRFPTFRTILLKALGVHKPAEAGADASENPQWIAGMFMLFSRDSFAKVKGFDESYFLYYEDVDVCARLGREGLSVGFCREAQVFHDARRTSHRNLRYLRWHVVSMLRFLWRRAAGRL